MSNPVTFANPENPSSYETRAINANPNVEWVRAEDAARSGYRITAYLFVREDDASAALTALTSQNPEKRFEAFTVSTGDKSLIAIRGKIREPLYGDTYQKALNDAGVYFIAENHVPNTERKIDRDFRGSERVLPSEADKFVSELEGLPASRQVDTAIATQDIPRRSNTAVGDTPLELQPLAVKKGGRAQPYTPFTERTPAVLQPIDAAHFAKTSDNVLILTEDPSIPPIVNHRGEKFVHIERGYEVLEDKGLNPKWGKNEHGARTITVTGDARLRLQVTAALSMDDRVMGWDTAQPIIDEELKRLNLRIENAGLEHIFIDGNEILRTVTMLTPTGFDNRYPIQKLHSSVGSNSTYYLSNPNLRTQLAPRTLTNLTIHPDHYEVALGSIERAIADGAPIEILTTYAPDPTSITDVGYIDIGGGPHEVARVLASNNLMPHETADRFLKTYDAHMSAPAWGPHVDAPGDGITRASLASVGDNTVTPANTDTRGTAIKEQRTRGSAQVKPDIELTDTSTAKLAANSNGVGDNGMVARVDSGGRSSAAKSMPEPNSLVPPVSANNNELSQIPNRSVPYEKPRVLTGSQAIESVEGASPIRGRISGGRIAGVAGAIAGVALPGVITAYADRRDAARGGDETGSEAFMRGERAMLRDTVVAPLEDLSKGDISMLAARVTQNFTMLPVPAYVDAFRNEARAHGIPQAEVDRLAPALPAGNMNLGSANPRLNMIAQLIAYRDQGTQDLLIGANVLTAGMMIYGPGQKDMPLAEGQHVTSTNLMLNEQIKGFLAEGGTVTSIREALDPQFLREQIFERLRRTVPDINSPGYTEYPIEARDGNVLLEQFRRGVHSGDDRTPEGRMRLVGIANEYLQIHDYDETAMLRNANYQYSRFGFTIARPEELVAAGMGAVFNITGRPEDLRNDVENINRVLSMKVETGDDTIYSRIRPGGDFTASADDVLAALPPELQTQVRVPISITLAEPPPKLSELSPQPEIVVTGLSNERIKDGMLEVSRALGRQLTQAGLVGALDENGDGKVSRSELALGIMAATGESVDYNSINSGLSQNLIQQLRNDQGIS